MKEKDRLPPCRWWQGGHHFTDWANVAAEAHAFRHSGSMIGVDGKPLGVKVGILLGQFRECTLCGQVEFGGVLRED